MKNQFTILIVDDEEGIRHGLSKLFEKAGYITITVDNGKDAINQIKHQEIDIVILDIKLKHNERGEQVLREIILIDQDLPVLLITGYGSIESAVEAMRNGASDYLLKPLDNTHILETVSRYIELQQLKRTNQYLKQELLSRMESHEIISQNKKILSLLEIADKVKDSMVPVLITGESGTGKELFARYIHYTGKHRDGPFVSVNCAAISESLLLSELFGHEKGSFTGAIERHIGKFELAHGGTLFLDEIGDMALHVQAKLLRVIEDSSFERVGGVKKIKVNIRIITATNKDINNLVNNGLFREDLFYRINTVHLHLPALRDHPDDIPLLISYYLKQYANEYHKIVPNISQELMNYWMEYSWPGNIRELKNVINNLVLLNNKEIINITDIYKDESEIKNKEKQLLIHKNQAGNVLSFNGYDFSNINSLKEYSKIIKEALEKEYIIKILCDVNWNQSKAAKILKISRKTLLRKINDYNIRKNNV
jgi:DNA-binding NtrC family response regulator